MFCEKCGKQLREGAKFCTACGSPVKVTSELTVLVSAAKNGDQSAIEELYNRTFKKYEVAAAQILGKKMASDEVYDVLQDSYVKMFRSLDKLDDPEKFTAWGKRIVTNTALNAIRGNTPVFMEDDTLLDVTGYDPERDRQMEMHDPGEIYDREQTRQIMAEIIGSLPEEQAKCVYLFYMQEMSVKDIASTLGVSDNTVKSRLKYGRNKIEQKVLEIEKMQGIRLHSMAPFTFFLGLYSQYLQGEEVYAAAGNAGSILESVLAQMAGHTAASSAGAAGTAGAGGKAAAGATGTAGAAGKATVGATGAAGAAGKATAGATGAAGAAGKAAVGAAGKTAAAVAAGAAGKAAGTSIFVKVAAAAAAAVVVGGGAFGVTKAIRPQTEAAVVETTAAAENTVVVNDQTVSAKTVVSDAETAESTAPETTAPETQTEPAAPDPEEVYSSVLDAYMDIAEGRENQFFNDAIEKYVEKHNAEEEIYQIDSEFIHNEVYENRQSTYGYYNTSDICYAFRDLNKDGEKELLIGSYSGWIDNVHLLDIWSGKEKKELVFCEPVVEGFFTLSKDDMVCELFGDEGETIVFEKMNEDGSFSWDRQIESVYDYDNDSTTYYRMKTNELPESWDYDSEYPEDIAEKISEKKYNKLKEKAFASMKKLGWKPMSEWNQRSSLSEEAVETEAASESGNDIAAGTQDWSPETMPADYQNIISEYKKVLEGDDSYDPGALGNLEQGVFSGMFIDILSGESIDDYVDVIYTLLDLNDNGVNELLILGNSGPDKYYDGGIGPLQVWKLENDSAEEMICSDYRYYVMLQKGKVLRTWNDDGEGKEIKVYKMNNEGTLDQIFEEYGPEESLTQNEYTEAYEHLEELKWYSIRTGRQID